MIASTRRSLYNTAVTKHSWSASLVKCLRAAIWNSLKATGVACSSAWGEGQGGWREEMWASALGTEGAVVGAPAPAS